MATEVGDKMVGDKYCTVFGEGVADLDGIDLDGDTYWRLGS